MIRIKLPQRLHRRIERAAGDPGKQQRRLQQRHHVGVGSDKNAGAVEGRDRRVGPVQAELLLQPPHIQRHSARPAVRPRRGPDDRSRSTPARRAPIRASARHRRPRRFGRRSEMPTRLRVAAMTIMRRRVRLRLSIGWSSSVEPHVGRSCSLWSPARVAAQHIGAAEFA